MLRILQKSLHSCLRWGLAAMLEALGRAGVGSLMGKAVWVPFHSAPSLASQTHAFSDIRDIFATTNQALSWALRGRRDCCQCFLARLSSQSLEIEGDGQVTDVAIINRARRQIGRGSFFAEVTVKLSSWEVTLGYGGAGKGHSTTLRCLWSFLTPHVLQAFPVAQRQAQLVPLFPCGETEALACDSQSPGTMDGWSLQ